VVKGIILVIGRQTAQAVQDRVDELFKAVHELAACGGIAGEDELDESGIVKRRRHRWIIMGNREK
jgi:hypothetical protein